MKHTLAALFAGISSLAMAQSGYWQQHVNYDIDITLDHTNHQFKGLERIEYTNNSPDTLHKAYIHLYFNAFQPNSMMDVRSLNIADPDRRVMDRISKLSKDEIGYHEIEDLQVNGMSCHFTISGTIMKLVLPEPIAPGEMAVFDFKFKGQVPLQIRRSGRDNKEGIDYTMTQWYPKMAEYDKDGWHPNQYVGREFYGVYGSYDVTITMDKDYVIAGTGTHTKHATYNNTNTWNFKADNVHDFAWAADPNYQHDSIDVPGITTLHFYYQTDTLAQQWKDIQPDVKRLFEIMSAKFGKYPYEQFSVIQGGDGGMEYPMCTMILGHGEREGKVGLIAHESFHNWYYGILGSDEFQYPWMDEGFTTYAEEIVLDSLYNHQSVNPLSRAYDTYRYYTQQPWEEPMTTPADFYHVNAAYSINSYYKGAITLSQLEYIVGKDAFATGMLRYFEEWKFKHPAPKDFLRVMELTSDMELDWYFEHWVNTTKHIDYGIDSIIDGKKKTEVILAKLGDHPMPLDVKVTLKNGEEIWYNIPLKMMLGMKKSEQKNWTIEEPWQWTNPTYQFTINAATKDIETIEIDPTGRLADMDLTNNIYPAIEVEKEDK